MSLDISLIEDVTLTVKCPHCWTEFKIVTGTNEVFSANITHNLNTMADAAGIYRAIWRPEENGISTAKELADAIEAGVNDMQLNPSKYEKYNSPNRWGMYENFVPWLLRLISACRSYPNAKVKADR